MEKTSRRRRRSGDADSVLIPSSLGHQRRTAAVDTGRKQNRRRISPAVGGQISSSRYRSAFASSALLPSPPPSSSSSSSSLSLPRRGSTAGSRQRGGPQSGGWNPLPMTFSRRMVSINRRSGEEAGLVHLGTNIPVGDVVNAATPLVDKHQHQNNADRQPTQQLWSAFDGLRNEEGLTYLMASLNLGTLFAFVLFKYMTVGGFKSAAAFKALPEDAFEYKVVKILDDLTKVVELQHARILTAISAGRTSEFGSQPVAAVAVPSTPSGNLLFDDKRRPRTSKAIIGFDTAKTTLRRARSFVKATRSSWLDMYTNLKPIWDHFHQANQTASLFWNAFLEFVPAERKNKVSNEIQAKKPTSGKDSRRKRRSMTDLLKILVQPVMMNLQDPRHHGPGKVLHHQQGNKNQALIGSVQMAKNEVEFTHALAAGAGEEHKNKKQSEPFLNQDAVKTDSGDLQNGVDPILGNIPEFALFERLSSAVYHVVPAVVQLVEIFSMPLRRHDRPLKPKCFAVKLCEVNAMHRKEGQVPATTVSFLSLLLTWGMGMWAGPKRKLTYVRAVRDAWLSRSCHAMVDDYEATCILPTPDIPDDNDELHHHVHLNHGTLAPPGNNRFHQSYFVGNHGGELGDNHAWSDLGDGITVAMLQTTDRGLAAGAAQTGMPVISSTGVTTSHGVLLVRDTKNNPHLLPAEVLVVFDPAIDSPDQAHEEELVEELTGPEMPSSFKNSEDETTGGHPTRSGEQGKPKETLMTVQESNVREHFVKGKVVDEKPLMALAQLNDVEHASSRNTWNNVNLLGGEAAEAVVSKATDLPWELAKAGSDLHVFPSFFEALSSLTKNAVGVRVEDILSSENSMSAPSARETHWETGKAEHEEQPATSESSVTTFRPLHNPKEAVPKTNYKNTAQVTKNKHNIHIPKLRNPSVYLPSSAIRRKNSFNKGRILETTTTTTTMTMIRNKESDTFRSKFANFLYRNTKEQQQQGLKPHGIKRLSDFRKTGVVSNEYPRLRYSQ